MSSSKEKLNKSKSFLLYRLTRANWDVTNFFNKV